MSLSTAFLAAERDRAAVRRDARGAALVASRRRPTTSRDRPSVGWCCSTEDKTVCVEWAGANEPEWVPVATVKRLRAAMTRARNRQLALRPK